MPFSAAPSGHAHKMLIQVQPQIRPRFESVDCSGSDESNHNERASLRLNSRLGCEIYRRVEVLGNWLVNPY